MVNVKNPSIQLKASSCSFLFLFSKAVKLTEPQPPDKKEQTIILIINNVFIIIPFWPLFIIFFIYI